MRTCWALVVTPLFVLGNLAAQAPSNLERKFTQTIKPFVNQYCIGCHGGATPAAQFDMRPYSSMDAVVKDFAHWALVLNRLEAKEMPPKQIPQPTAAARQEVIAWIQAVRAAEARKNAGDPGLVLARRLSNAEYNYTIRDLTGVDIKPTREFPVDPANPEGFDNSGESLSMSPALLRKYLQAARGVAEHMVLKPDGFDFATHPMLVETDREKYTITRIVDFYLRQPTDYADYFEAAWRYKHRAALGKPRATLADFTAEAKLSQKYMPLVWAVLEEPKDVAGPIEKLQSMWRALPAPKGNQLNIARDQCVEMREFVVRMRRDTAVQFASPIVRGLSPTSQPLMNWKLRNFASHRRKFDPKALRVEGDPSPEVKPIPRYPGLGQESAFRAAALMAKWRAANNDLVVPAGQREKWEAAFTRFANVFPDVFYIKERGRFFPDDSEDKGRLLSAGYHNVMGYFRDDTPLQELILDDKGIAELNKLWNEFDYIADFTTRTYVQYFFNQSGEVRGKGRESGTERPTDRAVTDQSVIFGLRDEYIAKAKADPSNDPIAFQAIPEHFQRVNDTIRWVEKMRADAEPHHLNALLKFAARAYRRPLTPAERDRTLSYYKTIREKDGLTHEEAMRDSIVSVLMSPHFCYRIDLVSDGTARGSKSAKPLSAHALASRLSYFLWSSMPDETLVARATAGDLQRADVLVAQARRMLKDPRARGLATEFAGNWLDFRRFEEHNAVDRDRFPSFDNDLRQAMFEEPVRFIEDVIRNNRSVLDFLYAKHTFVNPPLAKHYGIPDITGKTDHWVRIEDATPYGRGSLLPMSAFLTKNSPGLRTSPVKRGYWVVRNVLGETIPPPPASVPELPTDEAKLDLPLRDMLAKHRENPACASCHARFDSFGLAFEGYGPVGDRRAKDLAGRPVDTQATFPGGSQGAGPEGVQAYIRQHRQKDFLNNLSRKLLAYALGRSLQLSDEPVIDRMQAALAANGYHFAPIVDIIVTSPQFLNKREVNKDAETN